MKYTLPTPSLPPVDRTAGQGTWRYCSFLTSYWSPAAPVRDKDQLAREPRDDCIAGRFPQGIEPYGRHGERCEQDRAAEAFYDFSIKPAVRMITSFLATMLLALAFIG